MKFEELYEAYKFEALLDEEIEKLNEIYLEISKDSILKAFGKAGLIIIVTAVSFLSGCKASKTLMSVNDAYQKGVDRAKALGYTVSKDDKIKKTIEDIYTKKQAKQKDKS